MSKNLRVLVVLFPALIGTILSGCSALKTPGVVVNDGYVVFTPALRGDKRVASAIVDKSTGQTVARFAKVDGRWIAPSAALPGNTCLVLTDQNRQLIPVRMDRGDPYTFRSRDLDRLRSAEAGLRAVEAQRQSLLDAADQYRRDRVYAKNWLENSTNYRDGRCLRPEMEPIPPKPSRACEPGTAQSYGTQTCAAALIANFGCSEALSAINKGAPDLATRFLSSVSCSALGAQIQGEPLTVGEWVMGEIIDQNFMLCAKQMAESKSPEQQFASGICALIFGIPFTYRFNSCVENVGQRCSASYDGWAATVGAIRARPDAMVAECRSKVDLFMNGEDYATESESKAKALASNIQSARALLERTRTETRAFDLTDSRCF